MLRGVNVGGHNQIKMDSLRLLCQSLGYRDVQTYIQSGNIVFRTRERGNATIENQIALGIEEEFGIRCGVVVRTVSELRDSLEKNPFAERTGIEPGKLLFLFLATEPSADVRSRLQQINSKPEELRISKRELYIYFPNGMGRPKLSIPMLERTLGMVSTGRNWNTVKKLLQIAENLEQSAAGN